MLVSACVLVVTRVRQRLVTVELRTTSTAPRRPSTPATLRDPRRRHRTSDTARTVDVDLRLDHAHLVPATQVGGTLRPDRGHIHLSVDGQLVAMPLPARTTGCRASRPGATRSQAEFVASDHLPFANRVVAAVTFRVR